MTGGLDGLDDLDADARLALTMLQGGGVVGVQAFRDAGVTMPAQAIYALQLGGVALQRQGDGWRLARPEDRKPPPQPPPRVRRIGDT